MWDIKRFRARTRSASICLFSAISLCGALQSHAQTDSNVETTNIQIQTDGPKFDLRPRKVRVVRYQIPLTIKPDQKMGAKIYADSQIIDEAYKAPQGYSLDQCQTLDDYFSNPALQEGWIKYSHKEIAKKTNTYQSMNVKNLPCRSKPK